MSSAIKTPAFQAKAGNIQNEDGSSIYSGGEWSFKNASAVTGFHITASGNVGIGTSSPITFSTYKILDIRGTSGGWLNMGTASTSSFYMYTDGTNAAINTQTAGHLAFGTSNTERMRIDASGNLLVGTTSSPGYHSLAKTHNDWAASVQNSHASSPFGLLVRFTGSSPNSGSNHFLLCLDTTTTRMNVYSNGGIANYQGNNINLSDKREKKEFAPAKSYLDVISQIPVQTFKYIDQTDEERTLGVVAQDVQAVAPELVSEDNWGTEEEPKPRLAIYQTDLQYALMKCIQELKEKNDALEARLAALEVK